MNTNTSLTSKLLSFLGSLIIGKPEDIQMPPEFYHERGDRPVPSPSDMQLAQVQRDRLLADAMRRTLTIRISILVSVVALAASTLVFFVKGLLA